MAVLSDTVPVTRRELYAAVAPVWIYLLIMIANSMRSGARWSDIVLFVAAAISTVWYLRAAYRTAA